MDNSLTARLRIVTPMFIGDASQKPSSVRAPSIKGALRFWWRALDWGACFRKEGQKAAALRLLHRREAELFGSAAKEGSGGQASFILEVTQPDSRRKESVWPSNNTGSGYLGFGLMESGSVQRGNYQPHREGLAEGGEFGLNIAFRRQGDELRHARESLIEALEAWSLFGGLGSRARRGFGSVTLLRLNGDDRHLDRRQYEDRVRAFLQRARGTPEAPPFTAFSGGCRFSVLATAAKARDAHEEAGLAYKQHRGQASSLRGRAKIPFGLPLQAVDIENRRASPLLFHVHELADRTYLAGVLFIPAFFHPRYPDEKFHHVESFVAGGKVVV